MYISYRKYFIGAPVAKAGSSTWGRIQRKTWCMGPYAGVDLNLTLCPLQSRHQHIYHGQPYARVDLNPMPELSLSPSQGLWIWTLVSWASLTLSTVMGAMKLIYIFYKFFLSNQYRVIKNGIDACSDNNPPSFFFFFYPREVSLPVFNE
jgi:hypothetical protein